MPSGKQILLEILSRHSQKQYAPHDLEKVTNEVLAGLFLHGSTADETWFKVTKAAWLSEGSGGFVRQGLGLRKGAIFLSDLFEAIWSVPGIPESVKKAHPDLSQEDYEAALSLMWLILSACQYFEGLESVENGGLLDESAAKQLVGSYIRRIKLFRQNPLTVVGLTELPKGYRPEDCP